MNTSFKNLTIKQLRLIAEIGNEHSLSRAAQNLYMTQPAASRSLAQLESALGLSLFERQAKRLVPTSAGRMFLGHAQRVLHQLEAAERDMYGGAALAGDITIGAIESFSSALLSDVLQRLGSAIPGTRIKVRTSTIQTLYGHLLSGSIDLMLSHAELPVDLQRVEVTAIYDEFTSVVCGNTHVLAHNESATWEEIAAQPWILPPYTTPSRSKLDRIIAIHRPSEAHSLPDLEIEPVGLALRMLARGQYLWILPHREALAWRAEGLLTIVPQPEVVLRGQMCCLALRASPARALVTRIIETVRRAAAG